LLHVPSAQTPKHPEQAPPAPPTPPVPVVPPVPPLPPALVVVVVVKTTDPPSVTSQRDPASQAMWGNGRGHQHSTDTDGGVVAPAHEFGHAMGLGDEYSEGPRKADGTRSVVATGPAGGLMGHVEAGSRPTPANFDELVNGRRPRARP
jgi:hypothetical protein